MNLLDITRANANTLPAQSLNKAASILREALLSADQNSGNVIIEFKDLAPLYAALNPPKKVKKGEFDLSWVYKAVAVKDVRYCLNQAYCDGENMVCTDGHRLHWQPCDKPPGFYGKDGELLPDQAQYGTYPDYKRAIPQAHRDDKVRLIVADLPIETAEVSKAYDKVKARFADCYRLPNGALVSKKYFDDMANGQPEVIAYLRDDKTASLLFELPNNSHAVIMPIRG